jgi:hypothetical protein
VNTLVPALNRFWSQPIRVRIFPRETAIFAPSRSRRGKRPSTKKPGAARNPFGRELGEDFQKLRSFKCQRKFLVLGLSISRNNHSAPAANPLAVRRALSHTQLH